MLPLIRRTRGRVVNVSSCLCRAPSAVRGVHCALLSALEALSACLRRELRPRGVDVVVVAPGEHTAGTAWLSDTALVEQARDMWRMLSDEQKGVYGEDYFEQSLRSLEKYTKGEVSLCILYKFNKSNFGGWRSFYRNKKSVSIFKIIL